MKGVVIKLTMSKHEFGNSVTLCNPVPRLIKYRPNTPEMFRRSFMASVGHKNISTILYDVVSISIEMRKIVYNFTKGQATSGRKVLVFAGVLRSQELGSIDVRNLPYMVVDSNINTSRLLAQKTGVRILNCDAKPSMLKQVKAVTRSFGNIMIFDVTFQDFLVSEGIMECFISRRLRVTFSFSLSCC